MVRLFLQVKTGPKSTKSCFSYCCCDVLCILHAFEHHKTNLTKYDLSRIERVFSGQFEELKQRCFQKLITLNSFWGKTSLKWKIFLLCVHKIEKKMKITCRLPIKKFIYLCSKLIALHLLTALQQKFITTLTKCLHLWKNSFFPKTLFHMLKSLHCQFINA